MLKRLTAAGLAAGLLMGFGAAQATTINAGLTSGVLNTVLDESRESFVDFGGPGGTPDGVFGVGDVIFGYVRVSDFQPAAVSAGNAVYAVFSQEVISAAGITVGFGPTTVAGLTLSALTGIATPAGSIFALYDRPAAYGTDLVNAVPAGATKMKDYIDFITAPGSTLRIIGGFSDFDDFLISTTGLIGLPTSVFVGLPTSLTLANTAGALSILFEDTVFTYVDGVLTNAPPPLLGPFAFAEIAVSSGTVAGSGSPPGLANPIPQTWLVADYGAFSFTQCLVPDGLGGFIDTPCGFIDKNNFQVIPIPEPGSLALLGAVLLAAGGAGWFRRR